MFRHLAVKFAGITCAGLLHSASASAIEEVVVSASPLDKEGDAVSQPISVLSGDQLRQRAAASIGQTLEGEPGIGNASFGPAVGAPVIRGQSGNRVRVLQDNLGTMDAAASSPDHSLTVEALLANRIEILRGPATLRYGAGAIGGVVNVLDNRIPEALPETTNGALEYRHGSVSDGNNAVALLEGASGNLAWHLDGIYRDSNNVDIDGHPLRESDGEEGHDEVHEEENAASGYIPNSHTRSHRVTGGASWILDNGFIGISVSQLDNRYGIPPGAHGHGEADPGTDPQEEAETVSIDMEQTRTDLKGEFDAPFAGFKKLTLRLGYNDYRHAEIENGQTGTVFDSESLEGRLELVHLPVGNWRGAVGLQGQYRDFAAIGEEAFIPVSTIQNQGIFLVEEYTRGDWVMEFGLRFEHQDIDPQAMETMSHNTFNASASALWHLAANQHVSLNLTRAQRAPSVEELLSNGPHLASESFDVGNPGLKEETGLNLELGYHYHGEREADINLFYNDYSDYIFRRNTGLADPEEALAIFRYDQQDARFYGLEAQWTMPINDLWRLRLFGDYVRGELDDNGDVPRITPPRYGLELTREQDQWDLGLRVTGVEDQDHPGNFESETDGHTRVDAHLNYRIVSSGVNWLLFARATNLLDEEIRNAVSFLRDVAPEPGRNLTVGARVTF